MNITLRKLALLKKTIEQQEETAKIQGYTTNVINAELKKNVTDLVAKIRII